MEAYLVPVLLEARPVLKILDVLSEPRQLFAGESLLELLPVLLRERADAVAQEEHHAHEERRDGAVCDRVLANRKARRRQRGLQLLDRLQEGLRALPEEERPFERRLDVAVVDLDEPARLRTEHSVLGEESGVGEQVRDELDERERLRELRGVLGRFLCGDIGSPVCDRRNLKVVTKMSVRTAHPVMNGRSAVLTRPRGLIW